MAKFKRRLTLSNRECAKLLAALDSAASSDTFSFSRVYERVPFRLPDLPLFIEHPEGGSSCFLVYGRNLSRRGISILHGGYIHNGSKCRILLVTQAQEAVAINGEIRHCRLVTGSVHELGIQFSQSINPEQFVLQEASPSPPEKKEADSSGGAVDGTVLIAEAFEPDRLLMEHQLKNAGLKVLSVHTAASALDVLATESVDLILSGLNLLADDGVQVLQRMRQLGYSAPILFMTADNSPETLSVAMRAGASDVVVKPISSDMLLAQIQSHLTRKAAPDDPYYSAIEHQSGMHKLIARYIEQVRTTATQLKRSCEDQDFLKARNICCQLKGSGMSYGFYQLTVAATHAITAIDDDLLCSPSSQKAMKELLDCCLQLSCHPLSVAG